MNRSIEDVSDMIKCICIFNSKNKLARKWVRDEGDRNAFSCFFTEYVMGIISGMKSLSANINTFNVEDVVKLTIEEAMRKIAFGSSRKHIHWAPTQSGKSAFKAVKICAFLAMNIPVIVLTKGKKESEELEEKISGYLKGHRFEKKILSVYGNEEHQEHIEMSFRNDKEASVLIIPDTFQKIGSAHDFFSDGMKYAERKGRRIAGCALILDEVDAVIDRSEKQDQRNEKGLNKLIRNLKPSLVMVTATPIPVLLKHMDVPPIITTSNQFIEDYIGVKDMRLVEGLYQDSLNDGFGTEVKKFSPKYLCNRIRENQLAALFLDDKLQNKNKFPNVWNKKNPNIPKWNNQCTKLLRKEIGKKGAKGALVLVDTCAWVDASKNKCIFHQASGVQDFFVTFGQGDFIAIVVHAEKVYYRLPGHSHSFECRRSLCELINEIDSNKKYSLGMAVVVFGYYAMKRSRSFRSNKRVPTAMIINLGDAQSNESVRQAAGRLTFKGRKLLLHNRKTNNVFMLCPTADFQVIHKHDLLVKEIFELYSKNDGMSIKDIMCNLARSSKNYFLQDSKRRTGNFIPDKMKKARRGQAKNVVSRSKDKESKKRIFTDLSLSSADKEFTDRTTSAGLSLAFADKESTGSNSTDSPLNLISNQEVTSSTAALRGRIQGLKDHLKKTSNPTVGNTNSDHDAESMPSGPENDRERFPQSALDPYEIINDENSVRPDPSLSDLSLGSSFGTSISKAHGPDTIGSLTTLLGKRKVKSEEHQRKRYVYDIINTNTNGVIELVDDSDDENAAIDLVDDSNDENYVIDLVDDSDDIDLTLYD
jgi:hypothetical protein